MKQFISNSLRVMAAFTIVAMILAAAAMPDFDIVTNSISALLLGFVIGMLSEFFRKIGWE